MTVMEEPNEEEQSKIVFKESANKLLAVYPEVIGVGFFGSRIRGISKNGQSIRPDSDIDFFIVSDDLSFEKSKEIRRGVAELMTQSLPFTPHFEGIVNVNSPKEEWDLVLGENRKPEELLMFTREQEEENELRNKIFFSS